VFCLLVVLSKLSLLAKWLARKTPLRKPSRGEGIVSRKRRSKSAHDFLGLLYCFIVLLCICVVFCPYVIYYPTVMARYSLFVLKVPLNPKQTNKQIPFSALTLLDGWQEGHPACKKLDVGGDDLTGDLYVLQLQLSTPPPSSLAPVKSRMETFWYLGPPGMMAVKTERDLQCAVGQS